ncbi:MAG: hypothetical protein NTW50_01195 [Candidatus Berkelbacteria bacterium]|nr:hypothetical protein [Candidatus Berkelbacteria bacterium]
MENFNQKENIAITDLFRPELIRQLDSAGNFGKLAQIWPNRTDEEIGYFRAEIDQQQNPKSDLESSDRDLVTIPHFEQVVREQIYHDLFVACPNLVKAFGINID